MATTWRAIGGIGRGAPIQSPPQPTPGGAANENGAGGLGNNQSFGFGGANQSSGFGQGTNFGGNNQAGGFGSNNFGAGGAGGFGGGNSNASGGGCRKCGQDGHFARECPSGGSNNRGGGCYKCGQDGHMARDCPGSQDGGFGGNDGNTGGFGGGGRGGARTCNKCNQEGHIARNCPNDGGSGGGGGFGGGFGGGGDDSRGRGRGCFNCGDEGHISRDCPQPRKPRDDGGRSGGGGFGSGGFGSGGFGTGTDGTEGGGFGGGFGSGGGGGGRGPKTCRKCGEEGHISRDCPSGGGGGGGGFGGGFGGGGGDGGNDDQAGGGRNRTCYNCGGEGHMSKDCTEPRKERAPLKCFRCNQEGHMSKDCTNEPVEGAENRKPAATHIPEENSVDNLWQNHIAAGINFDRYYHIPAEITGNDIERFNQPIRSFADANLSPQLLENVTKAGFKRPTPIQQYGISIVSAGRDLMACAQTGSGKTAAFLLPILTAMIKNESLTMVEPGEKQEPVVIIMVPTRELAVQIKDEARKFGAGTMAKVAFAYGGVSMSFQLQQIEAGCNILVATPGRALDLISKGRVGLSKCKYLVLDEADRMLEMGFEAEVRKLVQSFDLPPKTERQTMMFSATFPPTIQQMAAEFLNDHVFVTIGKVGAANRDIKQEMLLVEQYAKKDQLTNLITEDLEAFKEDDGTYTKKTLVFVERKRVADFVASFLSQSGVPTTSIHGDREQKERELAMKDFKSGRCPVLVATAVAARGLDIKGVDHVINYDLPQSIDDYVHRIGRTGRVGNPGRATSFFDPATDTGIASELLKILADAQQEVPEWLIEQATGVVGQIVVEAESGAQPTEDDFATMAAGDLASSQDPEGW